MKRNSGSGKQPQMTQIENGLVESLTKPLPLVAFAATGGGFLLHDLGDLY